MSSRLTWTVPAVAMCLGYFAVPGRAQESLPVALDAWIDHRFNRKNDTGLIKRLSEADLSIGAIEQMLRAGRASYPAPAVKPGTFSHRLYPLRCDHVDYETGYLLFVPPKYNPKKATPLLLVGHGGNGAMLLLRAGMAAFGGTQVWLREATRRNWIVAAPLTQRGWGQIGNSVLLSLISKLQRAYHIDPDRIYLTGHSMGGHLTWRSAMSLPDRFAAMAPMSGGYDFVKQGNIATLYNVPAFVTWCTREPYGIREHNETNAAWLKEHGYDWHFVCGKGYHTIPRRQLPKIADFFAARPRNLYRDRVWVRKRGRLRYATAPSLEASKKRNWPRTESWRGPHTWDPQRPILYDTSHWLRLLPAKDPKTVQTASASNDGNNTFALTTNGVRQVRIYLHPKMIDFAKPVKVVANGEVVFKGKVQPDPRMMLNLVREFDDRGRVFHAAIEVSIGTDKEVSPPKASD